jgi:hypothetical protein
VNTRTIAAQLGLDSKTLRRFIRSNDCTFQAVGQGGRYEFDEADIPVLADQLAAWMAKQAAKPPKASAKPRIPQQARPSRDEADREVWAEEGHVELPNIRDPRVLTEVRALAKAQEARLEEALMAAGLHISQAFDRV